MLDVADLSVSYGGLRALSGVSLHVGQGQFVTVVGANGAGKSTLFKAISGVVPGAGRQPSGSRGQDLLAMPAAARAHLGIAHVPEGRQVFKAMTVRENLELGADTAAGRRAMGAGAGPHPRPVPHPGGARPAVCGHAVGRRAADAGDRPRDWPAGPSLLMLDEPSMGLAPAVADMIFERISQIHREDGLTILLVEQRVAEALELCDRGFVLETGRMVLDGPFETLMADDRIRKLLSRARRRIETGETMTAYDA